MHVRIAHFVSRAKNKCFCGHIHIRYICTQCVREYYYSLAALSFCVLHLLVMLRCATLSCIPAVDMPLCERHDHLCCCAVQ